VLSEARGQLSPGEQALIGSVHLTAHVSGSGRVYQAGRDQHITEHVTEKVTEHVTERVSEQ
jgi:hypothetical protein